MCGRDTAPNRGILTDQASLSHSDMRLRCTICLHYQHFFCSDSVSSAFYKNLYEASTLETDGSPMWKAAWEVALLQYFDAVQKDFTCANCVQLVAGRCAAKSTVASNSETSTLCLSQLCDEKKMVLISRLYKESIAPLERLIEVRAKRLSVVLICRVVLHQALWHHFELQNVFSLLDEDIVGAFRASRKLISNCGSNLDNILPYWMFLRSNRFLDVLHPDNTPRRPAAEHAFLGELHQLLQHLLRMEQNNVSESVQFLLDNENFDRIVQMASLASSFVSFIHLILRICGGSVAKDSVFTALHDKLICFSDNNRINIAQFFLRNEVESESLNAKVNATSGVGAAPSAGEGKLNVIWTAVNIPEAPPDEGQVNPSDQTIDIKRNVEQQSKQKRNESLVLPSHVGTFIKRILGRNLKGEKTVKKEESDSTPPPVPTGNSFGDDLNKGQSDTAPAIKTESVSLAAPAMATVAKQPHSEFIWSEGIINYMSYLSSCFDVGILMDCPENVAKLSYLCQRLYISTTSICAHFDFATYRLGEQYHKKVFDADIIKNNEERLKMVKSACAEDLSKNMLILSEIVTKCSAIPEPKPHSEKMELYFRIRGAEIKEFKRLTPLQSRMNKFILVLVLQLLLFVD